MTIDVPLEEIYQEVILDHNRNPRNFRKMDKPSRHTHGYNPLCGDDYELFLVTDDGKVQDASFTGSGCAISKASASILTTLIKGRTIEEAARIKDNFLDLVTCGRLPEEHSVDFKKIKPFEGVRKFPIRVKCATLIWHALEEAMKEKTR